MTYEEILSTIDFGEKEELLKKFYIEEVKILDWIKNDEIQKILFRDRFEYKLNGKYHNLNGPAIKYKNGDEKYWINGEFFENKKDWEQKVKTIKRKHILKKFK